MIRSKKYLSGSKGAPCAFRIPGVCNGDWSTTVPCHIRDGHNGMGQKASDLCVSNGCSACHDAMDGRSMVLSREDWLFYALRGLQETLEQRVEAGLLIMSQDPVTPLLSRPVKPRKAKSERAAIASSPFQKPTTKRAWHKRSFSS